MRIATITNCATLLPTFGSGASFLAAVDADKDERIAVAAYPAENDAASLLSVAGNALLRAKAAGRDTVVIAMSTPTPGPARRVRAAS